METFFYFSRRIAGTPRMSHFLGEYDCRLDAKGRIMLPAGLKRQIAPEAQDKFVVNRGFEKCFMLYPSNEWESITAEINKLNIYNKKNREFVRHFFRGATELKLDGTGRLLIPKRMLEYADIKKDLILFAYLDRIEAWDKDAYEGLMTNAPDDFSKLAEEVMGKNESKDVDDRDRIS